MPKQVFKILFIFLPFLFFLRCAQVVPLTGGKRDTTPPQLLEALPANKTTHFNQAVIVLRFNEYVKLSDLSNQLVISPKLKTTPEVESDRKNIRITLKKEELAPNTTYRFAFGKAIADMNEGNALADFEYVFSTGDFIDSLNLKGTVMDAYTARPAGGVLIGLYNMPEKNSDSLPYKEAPDYTARSNDNGEFHIHNLPRKTFKAYAIEDKNKNYLYDGETEKIAFGGGNLELSSDSSIRFQLFQEESPLSFIKKTVQPYPGLAQILLNKKTVTQVRPLNPADSAGIFETRAGQQKDTISVFYKDVEDTLRLLLRSAQKTDTLKLPLVKKNKTKGKFAGYSLNTSANILTLNTPPVISFMGWMNILKTEPAELKLSSKEDSVMGQTPVKGRWLDVNHYEITNTLKEGITYSLKVDTCAFFDVNDICNDSSNFTFKTESRVEFGKVTLKLLLNKKQAYLVQLINEKSEVVKESQVAFSLSSSNAVSIDFTDIRPGTYLVRIIFDDNENHKWDTGNLLLKRQPERVIVNSKQIKVLSDWEIEEEIQIKD